MKKFLSISFSFLILLSGLHITIATHYCGGEISATKVSVSGELASCGMEGPVNNCTLPGNHLNSHCCNDKVSVFVVDNNYAPSFFQFKTFSQPGFQFFNITESSSIHTVSVLRIFNINVRPPGNYMVSAVSLTGICVFRI